MDSKIKVIVKLLVEDIFKKRCSTRNHGTYVHNPDLNEQLDDILDEYGDHIESDSESESESD